MGTENIVNTLSPERVAEIRARVVLINDPTFIGRSEIGEHVRLTDLPALLASHEALRAEVERLRVDNASLVNIHACDLNNIGLLLSAKEIAESEITTARDTAAREMREAAARIAVLLDDGAEIADHIRALPLPSEKETG